MASRDYYDILGVKRSASADEIRTAYRKLARQYHPDMNKTADAPAKFAEVQKAYEALSDTEKRSMYDQFGAAAFEQGGPASARPGPSAAQGRRTTWSTNRRTHGPAGGMDFDMDSEDLGSVFDAIFGGGNAKRGRAKPQPEEPEQVHDVRVDFLVAAKGGNVSFRASANGQGRTVDVRIPPGTEDGAHMRVRGAIAPGVDLLLRVHVLAHELWRRGEGAEQGTGLDIFLDLPLSIAEATLGATIDVPSLAGKVALTIPPGTASGRKLRMRGQGIQTDDGRKGDLVAIAQIVPPQASTLSDLEKDVLKRVAEASPRVGPAWHR